MARRVRVRVHPAAIQSLFMPGGDVWKATGDVQEEVARVAKVLAPHRSGDLQRAIATDVVKTNQYGCRASVYVDEAVAPHGGFVTGGTSGPITARGPHPMVLYQGVRRGVPARYRGTVGHLIWAVAGQAPNPFLEAALAAGVPVGLAKAARRGR